MKTPFIIEASLPPKECHAHNTGHWRRKAGPIAKYRESGHALARAALGRNPPPRWEKARLSLHFCFKDKRKRDILNAAQGCKALIDGIVDAQIIEDDNWMCLSIGSITSELDRQNPRVVVTIEPLD